MLSVAAEDGALKIEGSRKFRLPAAPRHYSILDFILDFLFYTYQLGLVHTSDRSGLGNG